FLGVGRKTNIKFIPETWANPDMSPGMYISYTYAKMKSALEHAPKADPNIMQDQIPLLSMAEYSTHAQQLAIDKLDPSAVVIHANKLATILSVHYNHNRIKDGDPKMVFAFQKATDKLEELMLMIGMHPLTNI
ncbi:hypothetical protein, partial [Streptomyces galilaeus]|uniref:hypothetical protein n=1 Tax=Streptomyces galilaeus TaxID=33899 RepID=UPI0038F78F1D